MPRQRRHKVFVSYHHENDQEYKDLLVEEMSVEIMDRSVEDGDIDDRLGTEAIWEKIRNEHIADATVVLVLIGRHTWSRKFVDWEIGSALNQSRNNPLCGVLGILLPDHPNYSTGPRDSSLLPQRLAANIGGDDPYVRLYDWPGDGSLSVIRDWVLTAFLRRDGPPPDNYSRRFKNNRGTSAVSRSCPTTSRRWYFLPSIQAYPMRLELPVRIAMPRITEPFDTAWWCHTSGACSFSYPTPNAPGPW